MIAELRARSQRRVDASDASDPSDPSDPATPRADAGFTLVELLIALVLSGVIAGVIVAALATSMNVASSTTKLVADSTDAGLISAFLYRDAQAAGAIDPTTRQPDEGVGVSTSAAGADWAGCWQPGEFVARFSWLDRQTVTTPSPLVATYGRDSTNHLTRRLCENGETKAELVLGNNITKAVATCLPVDAGHTPDAPCATSSTSVRLDLEGTAGAAPFKYSLTASLRGDQQNQTTAAGSSAVALLAIDDADGTAPCANLTATGSRVVTVIGDVVARSRCDGITTPMNGTDTLVTQTGIRWPEAALADPFSGITPPDDTCDTGDNPEVGKRGTSDMTVYPENVSIAAAAPQRIDFEPGVYVFCDGLAIGANVTVTGPRDGGVLLYIKAGNFVIDPSATVDLSARTATTSAEPYANLLVWVGSAQDVVIPAGPTVSTYRGYIYAPTSQITLNGAGRNNIGGIVARDIVFDGALTADAAPTTTRVGLPVPDLTITPSATQLPGGQVDALYQPTGFVAAGGTEPYTWSATGLPPGLALVSGQLQGTPTVAGIYSEVIVTALDATSAARSMTYTINVNPGLAVTPMTMPTGQVGIGYPATSFVPSGGTAPYTWSASGLPVGLTIDPATGVVSGSPTEFGSFTVSITVTDAIGASAVSSSPLIVNPVLAVAQTTMPAGQVGVVYPATPFALSGGSSPFVWSVAGLPAGLTLDPASGVVSGTPTESGAFTVTVTVTDAIRAIAVKSSQLTIERVLEVVSRAMPVGQADVPYPTTMFAAIGGSAPYSWSATGLPAGLVIDTATGVISGRPSVSGSFTVVVTVADAQGTATTSAALTVNPVLGVGTTTLPGGQVGVGYPATTLTPAGGTGPYTWSASSLPPGLTLDPETGQLSGTPTAAGTFEVVVTVVDATSTSSSANHSIVVSPLLAITSPVVLPNGQVGVAYADTVLGRTGGTAPFRWNVTGLPVGLTIDVETGVISGSPTIAGPFTLSVTVTDAIGATAAGSFPLIVNPVLAVTPRSMPTGQVGVVYPASSFGATGGSTPYTWSAAGLPAGLTIHAATGTVSGGPAVSGPFTVSVTVTDAIGATAVATSQLTINAVLAVTPGTLPAGQVGVAYPTTTFTSTGGTVPYAWSVTGLPNGLTIDGGSGSITGTPTVTGSFAVVVRVTDALAATATTSSTLTVTSSSVPAGCPLNPTGWRGEYFSNNSLSGTAFRCRDDAAINFNWASSAPISGMPNDNFSVRWTRTQDFAAGTYTFEMGTNDGGRLYVDGVLVLDRWYDQDFPSPRPTVVRELSAGPHTIVMAYYAGIGGARAMLNWTFVPAVTCPANPTGWKAEYFDDVALTGLATLCRNDSSVNFNWAYGSPATGVPVDNFSVRWSRTATFTAGAHTFSMGTDDGGRLWIDGVLVLDRWIDQSYPSPVPSVTRTLSAGSHDIVFEYYERGGVARALLTWT